MRFPRHLDPALATELEAVARMVSFRHSAHLDATAPEVGPLLVAIPKGEARTFLEADIRRLAGTFGTLLGRRHVHAQLYTKRSDGCRKFHADNVTLRLLCTYAGPGTDWIPNEDLVRKHMGRTDIDPATHNRLVLREGGSLRRSAPGEVLVFRGGAYPGQAGRGAAHRSPPLGSTGVARLVLKIDETPCRC
jgi:hypothetical protein